MEAHIEAIETEIHTATQNIITETGNKELKGLKMQAIWQLLDAIIVAIITYGSEGWNLCKKELLLKYTTKKKEDNASTQTRE